MRSKSVRRSRRLLVSCLYDWERRGHEENKMHARRSASARCWPCAGATSATDGTVGRVQLGLLVGATCATGSVRGRRDANYSAPPLKASACNLSCRPRRYSVRMCGGHHVQRVLQRKTECNNTYRALPCTGRQIVVDAHNPGHAPGRDGAGARGPTPTNKGSTASTHAQHTTRLARIRAAELSQPHPTRARTRSRRARGAYKQH